MTTHTRPESRLQALGLTLPTPLAPIAAYVPFVQTGTLLVVSGQLPMDKGALIATGCVGLSVSPDEATAAARMCAINVLAQVRLALGSLDRVVRVVRLGGFIAATPDFSAHASIMNGASSLMEDIFGEAGRHARSTIGVSSLPLGAPVEVEGLFEVEV